jgi:hypothetical protein
MVAYCSAFILKAKPPAVGFLSMGNKKRKEFRPATSIIYLTETIRFSLATRLVLRKQKKSRDLSLKRYSGTKQKNRAFLNHVHYA